MGKAQHELAHGYEWHNAIRQMRREIRRALAATAGTNAAPFATERNDSLECACVTFEATETMSEHTAL